MITKKTTLIVGQMGIIISFISLISQSLILQAIAQVIAAVSSLMWMMLMSGKKLTKLSVVSLSCCCVAVLFPNPWWLFAASTSRAIDYQIILWKTK